MMKDPGIAALVPQQGSMCLLDEVVSFDERNIVCSTISHRSLANPLRFDGRLPSCAGIEYGAQAMAAHGTLRAGEATPRVRTGLLAGVRAVRIYSQFLDDEPGPMIVRAECLVEAGGRLLYAFAVQGAGGDLVTGRIAVVLG